MWEWLHNFLLTHDRIKIFIIIYTLGAVSCVLFINLFLFLIWILVHYAFDIYVHRFKRFSWRYSLLHSAQNCRLDFMFFFIGLSIELILHYSIAVAASRGMHLLGNFLRVISRIAGAVKAAEGIAHLTVDLVHYKMYKEEDDSKERIKIETLDYIVVIVSGIFLLTAVYIALSSGSSISDVLYKSIKALDPTHIQGLKMFRY